MNAQLKLFCLCELLHLGLAPLLLESLVLLSQSLLIVPILLKLLHSLQRYHVRHCLFLRDSMCSISWNNLIDSKSWLLMWISTTSEVRSIVREDSSWSWRSFFKRHCFSGLVAIHPIILVTWSRARYTSCSRFDCHLVALWVATIEARALRDVLLKSFAVGLNVSSPSMRLNFIQVRNLSLRAGTSLKVFWRFTCLNWLL